MTEHRRYLDRPLGRPLLARLVSAARAYDVDAGGPYDCPGGVCNVWGRPGDLPSCWDAPLSGGAFGPSAYVGEFGWGWDGGRPCRPYVEALPYDLQEFRRRGLMRARAARGFRAPAVPPRGEEVAPAEWDCLLGWLEGKADFLFRLADLAPDVVGTRCPLCAWSLPLGRLLNEMVRHVLTAHPGVKVRSLTLGAPCTLDTDRGRLPLAPVERF